MKKIMLFLCAMSVMMSAGAINNKVATDNTRRPFEKTGYVQQKSAAPSLDKLKAVQGKSVRDVKDNGKNAKRIANSASAVKPVPAPSAFSNTYNYKCGPTKIEVKDQSTAYYSEYKICITQKAKNTAEYSKTTLYDNTVELTIDPDTPSIVGTFSTDDYSISPYSFLKSGSNVRYVSATETSTITIESLGDNKYALTAGNLAVENGSGTYLYNYNYCYDVNDLNDPDAPQTRFEFTFGGDDPGYEPVTPPAGLTVKSWLYSAAGFNDTYKGQVNVGWDNKDVYIQGLCVDFPTSWIKGTLSGDVVTFAKGQYLGELGGEHCWLFGCDDEGYLCDYMMSYDAERSKLSGTNIMVENCSQTELNFWDVFAPVTVWDPNADVERDTVDVVATGLQIEDLTQRYGEYVYAAKDGEYSVELWAYTDTPYGTFSYENGKLDTYSFLIKDGYKIAVTYGAFTVEEVDKVISLTGGVVGSDDKYYRLNLSCKTGGLQYDEQYIPFNAEFKWSESLLEIEGGGAVLTAVNESGEAVCLEFIVPEASTSLAPGTYPIDASLNVGTAVKSEGIVSGIITGCFAGNLTSSGFKAPFWFLTEGNVIVAEDGAMTVSAKNSYGVDISIAISAPVLDDDFFDEESGLAYRVVSLESGDEAVSVIRLAVEPEDNYSGEVVIPETVSRGCLTFKVKAVAGAAFSQCTGVTKITIPESVTDFGDAAFSFCTGLTEKVIYNGKAETVGKSVFYKVNPEFIPDLGK